MIEYFLIIHVNGNGKYFREFKTSSKLQIFIYFSEIFIYFSNQNVSDVF